MEIDDINFIFWNINYGLFVLEISQEINKRQRRQVWEGFFHVNRGEKMRNRIKINNINNSLSALCLPADWRGGYF